MTPLEYYQAQCKNGSILEDSHQLIALKTLEQVYFDVTQESTTRSKWYAKLRKKKSVTGVYLWGGVGIGKTLLMDCFFKCLPVKNKMRMHFHQFMQKIHNDLARLQGKADPLQIIAAEISNKIAVLCFDELFVSDITDAMLLGRLLRLLFSKGVCLIATSNSAPDDLYKYGLQRSEFLPAIAALKQHAQVIHLPTSIDYRLRHLQQAGVFYTPLGPEAEKNMEKTFSVLTEEEVISTQPLDLFGRNINVVKRANTAIWFDFTEICSVPRSQKDYLEISKRFKTIFISNIPIIPPDAKDTICLFISLVDVFYDAGIRLVLSAAEPVQQIYSRGYMVLEYTRTHSRLLEMQSMDYFASEESNRNYHA